MKKKIGMFLIIIFSLTVFTYAADRETVLSNSHKYLSNANHRLPANESEIITKQVLDESNKYGIDYRLVLALIRVESSFRTHAVSNSDCVGLMQIRPETGKHIAADMGIRWEGRKSLHKPDKNIELGVFHLSTLLRSFSLHHALDAYNRGAASKRLNAHGKYVRLVTKEYKKALVLLPELDQDEDACPVVESSSP